MAATKASPNRQAILDGSPRRQWNSSLSRKTPLKAKAYWKVPKPKNRPTAKPYRRSKAKGKALKAISAKRKVQVAEYARVGKAWLLRTENTVCGVCLARSMKVKWSHIKRGLVTMGEDAIRTLIEAGAKVTPATEKHHYRGRRGRLLCDTRFFIATCRQCRDFPHENPREARELELLAPPAEWEVYPGPDVDGFAQS